MLYPHEPEKASGVLQNILEASRDISCLSPES